MFQFHGLISYSEGLRLQEKAIQSLKQDRQPFRILGCEHLPVLTKGRRLHGKPDVDLSLPAEFEILEADRGGELALHTPGQLMIYPIVNLRQMHWSVKDYICVLHKVTKLWLEHEGVKSDTGSQSGLWTEKGKIAFLGIRVQNGISSHGLAINVHNKLSYYRSFVACGVKNAPVDHLNTDQSLEELFSKWVQIFRDNHDKILCSSDSTRPSDNL
jgi:lipoate-protein ligase B